MDNITKGTTANFKRNILSQKTLFVTLKATTNITFCIHIPRGRPIRVFIRLKIKFSIPKEYQCWKPWITHFPFAGSRRVHPYIPRAL